METTLDDFSAPAFHPHLKTKLLIDIVAQAFGIGLALFLLAINTDFVPAFIAFYFGVGSYQLISSLVHLIFQKKPGPLYRIYYVQLFIHLFFFLSMFFFLGILGGLALIYLSPLTALYYLIITIITYNEVRVYDKK